MITLLKYLGIIGALLAVTAYMPNVVPVGECNSSGCTEMPGMIEEGLTFFVSSINGIIDLFPWFEVVWQLILWALAIKFAFFAWSWIRWLIELIR